MLTLLRLELTKLYGRRGTYVSFALLLVLVLLIAIPIRCYKSDFERDLRREMSRGLGDEFVVGGKLMAGTWIPRFMLFFPLRMMLVNTLIPLLAAMAAGGTIAGEYSSGTLRTILTRPPSRWRIYAAKTAVAALHALILALFLGGVAFAAGYGLFGRGDLVFMDEPNMEGPNQGGSGLPIVPEWEAVQRLALAYALLGLAAGAVAALALFLSSFTSQTITAAGLTLGLLLLCSILGALGHGPKEVEFFTFFRTIRPYLLTTHMSLYEPLLVTKVAWSTVWHSALWLAGYAAAFLTAGLALFQRREILC